MSVVSQIVEKTGRILASSLPKWPKIRLGRLLCRISAAYASAIWAAYRTATGFGPHTSTRHLDDEIDKY